MLESRERLIGSQNIMMVLFEAAISKFVNMGQSDTIARANAALSMAMFVFVNCITLAEVLYLIGWVKDFSGGRLSRVHFFAFAALVLVISFVLVYRVPAGMHGENRRNPRTLRTIWLSYSIGSVIAFVMASVTVAFTFPAN